MLQERLEQIEARKKEMRSLLDVEGTDLKVLNDELDTLKTEEKEIRQKIKLAEELKEDPKNIIVEERSEKKVENINILSTAEYRSGYLKNLMGKKAFFLKVYNNKNGFKIPIQWKTLKN